MIETILLTQTKALFFAFYWAEGFLPIPKIFNLTLFLIVMVILLRKPLAQALRDRREHIRAELVRAREEKAAAEEKLRQVEARLNRLDQEVAEIRANAEREAQAEHDRLIKLANEEAERLKTMAAREIEGATRAAQIELREFAAERAVEMAETIIRKEIRPEDNSRLVNDFARDLEGVK